MSLTSQQKKTFKSKAHKLNPIVIVGSQGLTQNVMKEIDRGLNDHELIKIRINAADREDRQVMFKEICETTNAEAVQLIGGIGVIYRENLDK